MEDSNSYSAHDIETLKQKIATYRDTLTTLKTENSTDDYLFMKNEFNGFKTQISNLEGIMKKVDEKQSIQIGEHEQQVKSLSVQIDSLNLTVEELNQDISLILNKLRNDRSNDLIEAINAPVNLPESLNSTNKNEESEVDFIEEDSSQIENQTSTSSVQNSNLPPSYKQLQKFVNEAKSIEELPTDLTSAESIDVHKMYQEEKQHFKKQSFPSNSINPSQIYNGRHGNSSMKPTINLNNIAKKHTFSININKNPTNTLPLTNNDLEENETVMDYFDNTPDIIPIEEVENIIEISNETKQQETKDKDALSFLKFFRKKD